MNNEQLEQMTAGELCDLIDRAVQELTERNEEAREAGAHELWPATTGFVAARGFYTSVPPSKQTQRRPRR
ncbi:MAG TPA: hypothetical protein VNW90_19165 [Acetobacteraceae bacterium]|jgi:hypothetical protein|nr:hypothetical protein [Acetobacteraceae bacterium]